ncbi:MAG: bifunctional pyr operon transcriptional regulator/uracil phosphoribosyltransferase PyrR [Elusimicrobia bacterium]|nr:bifunctional pyr operon transcriptional regulator/uracil phosphoribosyltransferase PyrR [Elusimicrobiota bacterium]
MGSDGMTKNKQVLRIRETIPGEKVREGIDALVDGLLERFDFRGDDVAIVGIQTRGAAIANRVAEKIRARTTSDVPVGAVDITLYRDDLSTSGMQPVVGETHLNFDLDDKRIILIDDVLFTGRTVRAAIDEIMDFGRPRSITLAVLIDRGHRELPIAADVAPIRIQTKRAESVILRLQETDKKEEIVICETMPL